MADAKNKSQEKGVLSHRLGYLNHLEVVGKTTAFSKNPRLLLLS